MKKLPLLLLVSNLAFLSGGCGFFQQSEEPSEAPPVAESPQPPKEEVFESPPPSEDLSTYGLIPSTDPSQRRQEIRLGRDNPFSIIPVTPTITEKEDDPASGSSNKSPSGSSNKSPSGSSNKSPSGSSNQSPSGSSNQSILATSPSENLCQSSVELVSLPPLIPNEARGVLVSGILDLPGNPVAIIKAPNESVARRVTPGAVISNGQVIVKSIVPNATKPTVVLEQYGIPVIRTVGEPPAAPIEPPQAPPPDPNGYGKVRNLILLNVQITDEKAPDQNPIVNGTMCNAGEKTIKVSNLTLQLQDKNGKIINSMLAPLAASYVMTPGQRAEFDGRVGEEDKAQKSELGLRGRQTEDIVIKLVDWS